jgi:hypothetical protein
MYFLEYNIHCLVPGNIPGTHWRRRWVGPRVGMDILANSKISADGTKLSATVLFFCTLSIVSIVNWVQCFLSRLCFCLQGLVEETPNMVDWKQFLLRGSSAESFLPISPEEGSRAGLQNVVLRSELRRWIKSRRRRRRRLFYSAKSLYLAWIQTTDHLAHILATVPT